MFSVRRAAVVLIVVGLVGSSSVPAKGGVALVDGEAHRFDLERFKRLGTITSAVAVDEFGTVFSDRFIASAPGAEGGGRIFFVSEDAVVSSATAAELSSTETARLGEAWGDLGHPPGAVNALVVGAPGEPDDVAGRAAAKPAVLVVEYLTGSTARFSREVSRVTGPGGSLFGWRVNATDSQFPEASFNASYIVSAPLENRGKKSRAGAVYKFDTVTGRQLWKFKGLRKGELAGYDMLVVDDRDGDGFADVLVGAPGSQDLKVPGRLYVLSGRNGKVLQRVEAPEGAVLFGFEVSWGSAIGAFQGVLVSAPGTPKGRKEAVGSVYLYPDLDDAPEVFQGKRANQWFGIAMAMGQTHLFVGSFEGHRNAKKDMRGSVTTLLPSGKPGKTLRGKKGGQYFGRSIRIGAALAVGAPGAPPLFVPE